MTRILPYIVILVAAGCRSAATDIIIPPGASVGIGDGVCKVLLQITADVTDQSRQPLGGVEVSLLLPRIRDREQHQQLVGHTRADGRLAAPACYLDLSEYPTYPKEGVAVIELIFVKEGFDSFTARHQIPIPVLLEHGELGYPRYGKGHSMQVRVTLGKL